MIREGFVIDRCTVERLMHEMSLAGVIRGKPVRTTVSDKAMQCARNHVNRPLDRRLARQQGSTRQLRLDALEQAFHDRRRPTGAA